VQYYTQKAKQQNITSLFFLFFSLSVKCIVYH